MLLEIALEKVLTQQSLKLVSLQLFQVWSVDAMQSLKLLAKSFGLLALSPSHHGGIVKVNRLEPGRKAS